MPFKDLQKRKEYHLAYYYKNRAPHVKSRTVKKQSMSEKHRKRRYGLLRGEYETMLAMQGNRCAICGEPFVGEATAALAPVVDHCHTTNKVRGVLHNNCNRGIGFLKDNPILCDSAANYLRANG